jgi:hypothetical protein
MSELTLHQKQMMELGKENSRLSMKMRELRSIMRENGIGHLYPGTTEEHEKEVQIAAVDGENYFALQRSNWQNLAESEAWKRIVHNITAWLQLNYPEIRMEMPEELFNAEIAMELDVSKIILDKKGELLQGSGFEIKGSIK